MVLGFKSGIAVGVIGSICCAKLIFNKIAKDHAEAYIDRCYSNFANELAIKFNDSITEMPTEDDIDKCEELIRRLTVLRISLERRMSDGKRNFCN